MTDDELDELLAALPRSGPGPDFADRVMARVSIAAPAPARRRPSLAAIAALAVVVIGGLAGSVLLALRYWATLLPLGRRLAGAASGWLLDGARYVAAELIRSPGAAVLGRLASDPWVLLLACAAGSLVYLGGLLLLRHLILMPRQVVYGR